MHFHKVILTLGIASILNIGCKHKEKSKTQPNVLFISIDDLRPTLGIYGDETAITPHIDQIAGEGIFFKQAFCQAAVCAPSRASLMTGLRPDSTRVWHLGDQFRVINENAVTMPQYFSKHGYYTVNIGKIFHNYMPDSISWDEPDLRPSRYLKKEWLKRDGETFYISKEVNEMQAIKRDSLLKLRPKRYADGWNTGPAWEAADVHDSMYFDGAQTLLAMQKLSELAKTKQPFYMGLGFFRPHLPFAVPKKYWDLYDRDQIPLPENPNIPKGAPIFSMNSMYELRSYDGFHQLAHPAKNHQIAEDTLRILRHGYYASVSYVDALIGQLIQHLKELDIYENTVIILWGDHGWKLGDHNSIGKMTNYNIDLRVPVIVKEAQSKKQGLESKALIELVDLFPSTCELAGIPIPDYMQGTSFVPLIKDPKQTWKAAVYSQFHRRPKVSPDEKRYMGYSINTHDYHYIEWYGWDAKAGVRKDFVAAELYDRNKDPFETQNLATNSEFKALCTELSTQLVAGWRNAIPNEN